ncbi:hypothetical protein ACFV9W_30700 [Streptomyces sp. NPDC059897]|uniref:hypothetical protein n=1 Tax=Streptomyces sp. NPDC059897 TaxID=3346994 RepID=UPI0036667298
MNDAEYEDRLLMLAVTGEPLPADDPDAAAVAADVALLREQVRGLGDALASRPDPAPVPSPVPVRRRRPLRLAFGGLVAACAVSVFGGLVWLGVSAPGGGGDAAGSADDKAVAQDGGKSAASSQAMRIACSRILVEGRVTSITPRADGDVRVVLDVERSYRPERSVPSLTLTLDGTAERDLRPGTYTLIRVPVHPADRQDWTTGRAVTEARADILRSLPESRGLRCDAP